jgi:hypothetical protein
MLEKVQGGETLRTISKTVVVPSGVSSGSSVKSTCLRAQMIATDPYNNGWTGHMGSSVRVRTINPQTRPLLPQDLAF